MKLLQVTLYFLVFYLTLHTGTTPVLAQSQPGKKIWQTSQQFKPPVDNQPNPGTVGAGTRGNSCLNKQVITALLPANKLGLTLNKQPTFFWKMPPTPIRDAELSILKDKTEEVIYKTTLTLPEQPGIVSFTLPKTVAGLEANQTYRWYVTLICDIEDSSNNPFIEGLVKRIPPELKLSESELKSLEKADLLLKATIYANKGIWYDALNSLVKLRCDQPNDQIIKLNWEQFLESVGLNELGSEPLVDSCTTKN